MKSLKSALRYLITLGFFTLFNLLVNSQENILFHDVSDGLSQRTVTCIAQDNNDFLWIGTQYGLNKFDGLNYEQFYHIESDTNSLIRNNIRALVVDKKNNFLWIGTYGGGLDRLDLTTGNFSHFNTYNGRLSDDYILDIYLDGNQILWVATEKGGINILDSKTGLRKSKVGALNIEQIKTTYITSLCGDGDRVLAGTNENGLLIINSKSGTVRQKNIDNQRIRSIVNGNSGQYFIGTDNGVFEFGSNKNNTYNFDKLKGSVILSMHLSSSGKLYIGTENNGLYVYTSNKELEEYRAENDNTLNSISGNSIWDIYEDNSGIVWLGFYLQGLNKIDALENKFQNIKKIKSAKKSFQLSLVSDIEESSDSMMIWIGTDGSGIFSYDLKEETFASYEHIWETASITSLLSDSNNNLWLATWNDGVKLYDPETRAIETIYADDNDENTLSGNCIHSMIEDRQKNVWIACFESGLDIFNLEGKKIKTISDQEILSTKIRVLIQDCYGSIILGTEESGIQIIKTDEAYNIKSSDSFLHSQSRRHYNPTINDLYIDSECNLWIGSNGGLIFKPAEQDSFRTFTTKDGLPSNMIRSIEEDDSELIWASTNQGIFSFDRKARMVKNYTKSDGLLSNEFSKESSLKSSSGNLHFGSISGVNYFCPDSIKLNTKIPKVFITNVLVSDEKVDHNNGKIVLAHNQNDIRFEFATLNFTQPEQNQFKYKLEGLDEDWQKPTNSRSSDYRNLKPGNYTFFIKGSNNDDIWNENTSSISFKIKKPFYNTLFAWLVYFLLIGMILYHFIKNLLAKQKLKADLELEHLEIEKLRELDEMKSQFFANISHEFMTPLTMIISPLKGLISQSSQNLTQNTAGTMLKNAERLETYIEQILNLAKLESKIIKLQIGKYNFNPFLKNIINNFKEAAAKKAIEIEVQLTEEPIYLFYDNSKLEQVFVNLLSNAIKYTENGGKVTVVLSIEEEYVDIRIKDTGIGISKNHIKYIFDRYYREKNENIASGTGLGLSITKQLVELHQGNISVESTESVGSTFIVKLKKGNGHFEQDQIFSNLTDVPAELENHQIEMDSLIKEPSAFISSVGESNLPVILVVEDNPDIRNFIKDSLETNYNVVLAEDGQIGYELAQKLIPDVIISDVLMPNMNGYELCKNLKQNELTSHIAIIILTVKSSEESQKVGFEIGADHYITKPFNPSLLILRIKNILSYREKLSKAAFIAKTTKPKNTETTELKSGNVINGEIAEVAEVAGVAEVAIENSEPKLSRLDEEFLNKIEAVVLDNLGNSDFSINDLTLKLGFSKSQLYRKLKALLGISANVYIRSIRLRKAAELLKQRELNVSEITYEVGFNDLQYFRTCFKKQYGVNPSEYAKNM